MKNWVLFFRAKIFRTRLHRASQSEIWGKRLRTREEKCTWLYGLRRNETSSSLKRKRLGLAKREEILHLWFFGISRNETCEARKENAGRAKRDGSFHLII